jgi:hydrogenase expression/formation protein HypE
LRDLTRGGLTSALNEIAGSSQKTIEIVESEIKVHPAVQAACEMLGFDPLSVANEGRFVCFVPPAQADEALALLKTQPHGAEASIIGEVTAQPGPLVILRNQIGTRRLLDLPSGEQLPRIC